MTTAHPTPPKGFQVLYWTPRILGILAIAFISLFALDAFSHGTLLQKLGAFLMHMIPSLFLTVLLVYAWNHEKWGGILFLLIGIILSPVIFSKNYQMNNSIWISLSIVALITFPFIIVGILFLLHYRIVDRTRP